MLKIEEFWPIVMFSLIMLFIGMGIVGTNPGIIIIILTVGIFGMIPCAVFSYAFVYNTTHEIIWYWVITYKDSKLNFNRTRMTRKMGR